MRTVCVVLIVIWHSFIIHVGGWPLPEGQRMIPLYRMLASYDFAFALEAFVFISGYLFYRSMQRHKKADLLYKKLQRLILPSVIFSILYFALYFDYCDMWDAVYRVMNGCGHLWFLPMLFWCFVLACIADRLKIPRHMVLLLALLLNLFVVGEWPLQLSRTLRFFLYFYAGYSVYPLREKISVLTDRMSYGKLAMLWGAWTMLFAVCRPLTTHLLSGDSAILDVVIARLLQVVFVMVGIAVFYLTALRVTKGKACPMFVQRLSSYSFGIYIFQQFVLWGIYYYTVLPVLIEPVLLPWVGFVVAMTVSYGLSWLFLKTKIGRFLIG